MKLKNQKSLHVSVLRNKSAEPRPKSKFSLERSCKREAYNFRCNTVWCGWLSVIKNYLPCSKRNLLPGATRDRQHYKKTLNIFVPQATEDRRQINSGNIRATLHRLSLVLCWKIKTSSKHDSDTLKVKPKSVIQFFSNLHQHRRWSAKFSLQQHEG